MTNLTRAITRALTSPLTRPITSPGVGGGGFSPASLFASGEQGIWLDPSDFSTMFQDAAGTTPVTAAGQPVGRILDKSGRGNHASQATSASRPLLQQDGNGKYYLAFDGVDDFLSTASIDFTATDKMTVVAGVLKGAAADGIIAELSTQYNLNNGSFALQSRAADTSSLFIRGDVATSAVSSTSNFPVGALKVITATSSIASNWQHIIRHNGVQEGIAGTNVGTGNFGNYPLYIGRRGGTSSPFNGRLYQLIVRGAATPLADIQSAEAFTAGKTGVTLP